MFQGMYRIISKSAIAKDIYDMTVYAPEIACEAQAGQFVHVKVDGFSLRRPISICDIDKKAGFIRLVFEIRGDGTLKMSELSKESLIDLLAPLGNGFSLLESHKNALIIGGGIGVPPLLAVAKHYISPTVVIGFRSAGAVILESDFSHCNLHISTDDGSRGYHGFVTDLLPDIIKHSPPDIIYACGPVIMLEKIKSLKPDNTILQISLEERMACGVGACLVCACKMKAEDGSDNFLHVCKDGPVFTL